MDIVEELRSKIKSLPQGDFLAGLHSVRQHIETGFRHFTRGKATADETAFTDAVYRTNQAFEGSIKEAYRVLAGLDPARTRPFDIENYLSAHDVLRPRVLDQLSNYRQVWRNPSTHDYNLNFDESEAFLALISVTGFACVLIEQMSERISFSSTQSQIAENSAITAVTGLSNENRSASLLSAVTSIILLFADNDTVDKKELFTETQMIGALHAVLIEALPEARIFIEHRFSSLSPSRVDISLSLGDDQVIVELKKNRGGRITRNGLDQVLKYLEEGNIQNGIIYYYDVQSNGADLFEARGIRDSKNINIIYPKSSELIIPINSQY